MDVAAAPTGSTGRNVPSQLRTEGRGGPEISALALPSNSESEPQVLPPPRALDRNPPPCMCDT
eukprot:12198065-Alexandrium_andersonii.AAC.1